MHFMEKARYAGIPDSHIVEISHHAGHHLDFQQVNNEIAKNVIRLIIDEHNSLSEKYIPQTDKLIEKTE